MGMGRTGSARRKQQHRFIAAVDRHPVHRDRGNRIGCHAGASPQVVRPALSGPLEDTRLGRRKGGPRDTYGNGSPRHWWPLVPRHFACVDPGLTDLVSPHGTDLAAPQPAVDMDLVVAVIQDRPTAPQEHCEKPLVVILQHAAPLTGKRSPALGSPQPSITGPPGHSGAIFVAATGCRKRMGRCPAGVAGRPVCQISWRTTCRIRP